MRSAIVNGGLKGFNVESPVIDHATGLVWPFGPSFRSPGADFAEGGTVRHARFSRVHSAHLVAGFWLLGNDKSTAACRPWAHCTTAAVAFRSRSIRHAPIAVTKHAGAACPAYDIAIGGLTLYAFPPPNTRASRSGWCSASRPSTPRASSPPPTRRSCVAVSAISRFPGDWTSVGRVVTDGFWPAPGEQASVTVPIHAVAPVDGRRRRPHGRVGKPRAVADRRLS